MKEEIIKFVIDGIGGLITAGIICWFFHLAVWGLI